MRRYTRLPRMYMGFVIMPVSGGSAGIRWCANVNIGITLKADTLAGIKELIRQYCKGE